MTDIANNLNDSPGPRKEPVHEVVALPHVAEAFVAPPTIPIHDSRFIRSLVTVIGFILLFFWLLLGFVLWVPLMGRMILIFFSAVVSSMFTGRDPTHARVALDYAITFYSRGFELINSSMHGNLQRSGPFVIPEGEHFGRVLRELLFATLFWLGIIFFWEGFANRLFEWLQQYV